MAVDRIYLEPYDQLPKDARERCLTESGNAEDPVTLSPSVDEAVLRRVEEIAIAEAKQSSGELQARGMAHCMLSVGII